MQNIAKKVYNMSNIDNIEFSEYPVSFPVKEKAYALVTHDGVPFKNAATYQIHIFKLKSLSRVNGHKNHPIRTFIKSINVAYKGQLFQKVG